MNRVPLHLLAVVLAWTVGLTAPPVLASYSYTPLGPPILQNDPNCAGMKLDADDDVDQSDFGLFQVCYSGTELALPECTGQGGGLLASGTFVMHGRPVDVLPDGHTLLFVRARFYDLKNGRWLQRDPVGYADGGNLYEAFGDNALAATDPTGLYYKLWSTWENGAEVYWQDINPIGWWLTKTVSSELSLGQYQYIDGQKFVTYRGSVASDPLDPALYLIPFENLEGWAKQDISLSTYERFVFQHGIPIDRDGKVLNRHLLAGGLTQMFMALQDEQEHRFKELANWATTPFGTRSVAMLLSGGVDPITERNMTAREGREHIVRLAETGAAIYVGGRLLTTETGAAATGTAVAPGRLPPNPYGKLGSPAHRAKVQQIFQDIESRGLIADTEVGVRTIGGQKAVRYMDVVARDPVTHRIVEVHQVGKTLKSTPMVPVARERAALRDVRHSPEIRGAKRFFHGYGE